MGSHDVQVEVVEDQAAVAGDRLATAITTVEMTDLAGEGDPGRPSIDWSIDKLLVILQ